MATVHANKILTKFMLLLGGHNHCVKVSSDSETVRGMGLWEFSGALRELMLTSYHYQNNCIYVKIQRSRIIGGTQIITNKRQIHLFDEIIHLSMQFSAVLNIFIVKTWLSPTFTNDLKRK